MKADLRISIKDYRRNKSVKVLLSQTPFDSPKQFYVTMNDENWPADGRPVSISKIMVALRKSLVKAVSEESHK